MIARCVLLLVLFTSSCGTAGPRAMWVAPAVTPTWIDAGPMIGHVSHDEAYIWIRPAEGSTLEVAAEQAGRLLAPSIQAVGGGCRVVRLGGLAPETPLRVTLSRARSGGTPVVLEFATAPKPSTTGRVRIGFGSCIKDVEYGPIESLAAATAERPDVFVFAGDNTYYVTGAFDPDDPFDTGGDVGEWNSGATMLARHLATRRDPQLSRLARTVPCYGTWDDHDYGPNNSDATFEGRDDSYAVHRMMWANPSFGTPETRGVFSSFRRGPVEVFLMDNRSYRSGEDVSDERAAIWGDAQLAWLLDGLAASDAPVKVVVNGTQMTFKGKPDDGHWHDARREYYRFIDGLEERDVRGVLLLSGDRHYSELMRLDVPGRPALFEFTSSPIHQGRKLRKLKEKSPTRVWGMHGDSYGLVTVDVRSDGEGTVSFEVRDGENEVPVVGKKVMKSVIPLRVITER